MSIWGLFDVAAHINRGIEGAMHAAWKPARNFYEGVRGTTKYKDAAGEVVKMNPGRKLARRLKNDTKQIFTGNRYDMKNNLIEEELGVRRRLGNSVRGGLHFVGDATLGTVGTAIGWGVRGAGTVGGMITKPLIKPTIKGLGQLTKQGIDFVGDSAMGAADLVHALNKGPVGRGALFGIGTVGAFGIGMGSFAHSEFGASTAGTRAMKFYAGQPIDSVPGTITASEQMVDQAGSMVQPEPKRAIDNLGADGDLVLALHNLR